MRFVIRRGIAADIEFVGFVTPAAVVAGIAGDGLDLEGVIAGCGHIAGKIIVGRCGGDGGDKIDVEKTYSCEKCGEGVTLKVADYSFSKYKKILCFDCQKKEA